MDRVANNDKFSRYADFTLGDSLMNGLILPAISAGIFPTWTNNGCESLNHVIKSSFDRKKLALPQLIKKLRKIIFKQELDLERAIHGTGNFYLSPTTAHYAIQPHIWMDLSSSQKRKRVEEFTQNMRRNRNLVTSSDFNLRVLQSPSGSRKPGQCKGKHASKTTTRPK